CRSIVDNGFTFDYAGHIMFSNDDYVHQMYKLLLGDNVHWQNREAWVYSKGVYTRYPFQGALYGLPPEVIKECIVGAIEARFGAVSESRKAALATPQNGNGHNGHGPQPALKALRGTLPHNGNGHFPNCDSKDASITDCCADGVLESTAALGQRDHGSSAG